MPEDSGSKLNKKPKFIERFFQKKTDTEMVQEKEEEILSNLFCKASIILIPKTDKNITRKL